MRKPLSMKRLHMLSANFCINQLEKTGDMEKANELNKTMLDFLKYVWEHKDEQNLYALSNKYLVEKK